MPTRQDTAERAVELLKNKIKQYHATGQANFSEVSAQFAKEGLNPARALEDILKNDDLFYLHYWAFIALRSLASKIGADALTKKQIAAILIHTAIHGDEEWYKTINELARYKKSAPMLLDFFEKALSQKKYRHAHGMEWLAFSAVAEVLSHESTDISASLKHALLKAATREKDSLRKSQMEDVLALLMETAPTPPVL